MALVRTDRLEKEIETKDQELEEEIKKNVYSDKKVINEPHPINIYRYLYSMHINSFLLPSLLQFSLLK